MDNLANHGQRHRRDLPISSSKAEGRVGGIISASMGAQRRMRQSPKGAQRVAGARAAVLDGRPGSATKEQQHSPEALPTPKPKAAASQRCPSQSRTFQRPALGVVLCACKAAQGCVTGKPQTARGYWRVSSRPDCLRKRDQAGPCRSIRPTLLPRPPLLSDWRESTVRCAVP